MFIVNLIAAALGLLLLSNNINDCYGNFFREFENPPEWDISVQGHLYLHLKAANYTIPSGEIGKNASIWETRIICYGGSPNINDIPPSQCGIPGPTIVLHPNDDVQSVYLVNNLEGLGTNGHLNTGNEGYKDPDVINLHVCTIFQKKCYFLFVFYLLIVIGR